MPRAARIALAAALLALPGAGSRAQALDADSAEAARSLDADVRAYRRSCPGEAVTVSVQPAQVSPAAVARIVSLAAGSCFGQPGQNAYLVAKGPRGWKRVLSAEPGLSRCWRHGAGATPTWCWPPSGRAASPTGGMAAPTPAPGPRTAAPLPGRRRSARCPMPCGIAGRQPARRPAHGPPGCNAPEASRNDETLEPRCR